MVQTGGSKFPRLRVEIGEKLKKFVVVTVQMIKDPGGRKSERRIFQESFKREGEDGRCESDPWRCHIFNKTRCFCSVLFYNLLAVSVSVSCIKS